MNQLVVLDVAQHAPALVAAAGERASYRHSNKVTLDEIERVVI